MEKGGREAGREKNQPFVKAGEKKKKKLQGSQATAPILPFPLLQ